METVALTFQYTQREYVRAARQYLLINKTVHKYDIPLAAVFLVFSVAYLFFSSFGILSILCFGAVVVVTALGCTLYFFMPILKFKQTAKYQEAYTLVFSRDMISFQTASIASEMKWTLYTALWDTHEFYYLIQAPRIYAVIPKRAFKSQTEQQVFEALAQANLKTIRRVE